MLCLLNARTSNCRKLTKDSEVKTMGDAIIIAVLFMLIPLLLLKGGNING